MSDLISRQAAIDALCNDYCGGHQDCKYYPNCENLRSVQKLPSAQPAEPKRGKWIDRGERGDWEWQADGRGKHWHEWECNICHHYFAERSFFCPHCGSDMRGVNHESD